MSLEDVVTLNITRSAASVSRQGFGTALILGPNASGWAGDRVRSYASPAAMLTDGFDTSDSEYIAALTLYKGDLKPRKFKVGLRGSVTAQVSTITPTAVNDTVYTVTIDGVTYSFTSDASATAAEICTGLIALVNADAAANVTASGSTTLILTADVAGRAFSVNVGDHLSLALTTPNAGISEDLNVITAVDADWYVLILTSRTDADIELAADYIETVRKVFIACSNASAVLTSSTSDIASKIKAKSYARTAFIWSADQAHYPEAALCAALLPLSVGSWTAKFKTLKGIIVDSLTTTQENHAKDKGANVYTTVGGANILTEGTVAVGEFLDVIFGIDWIHVNMTADVFQAMVDQPKIPYTNNGGATFDSIITNRLNLAVKAEILTDDPAPVVTVPKVSEQPDELRRARRFGGIGFQGYLAGAVHAVEINGSVDV